MTARKIVDVPDSIFEDEAPPTTEPTPLEKFLGRERDPRTGKLVPKKKRSKRSVASSTFDRTLIETKAMIDSGEWAGCSARHLVALFVHMHEKTYGFVPTMSGKERYTAALMAGSFVKRVFDEDMDAALDYFHWLWARELEREKWRRENNRSGQRLVFKWTVTNRCVDDYRADLARKK